jgi:hypothetical protein
MYVDFQKHHQWSGRIHTALGRRGLKPDTSQQGEWEKHGPHLPQMPNIIFTGLTTSNQCIVIYPRAVYALPSRNTRDWYQPDPADRLPVQRQPAE